MRLTREYPKDKPHQSEFTIVKTEFYDDIEVYLAGLTRNPYNIKNVHDIIAYNVSHSEQEGGRAGTHPAWPKGQDNFEKCLHSRPDDATYKTALAYVRRKAREEGIDAALSGNADGLLVPLQAENGVACQVAAKAGEFIKIIVVL